MNILITGGTGPLGMALAEQLKRFGHMVAVTSRSAPPQAGVRRLDITSPESWDAAVTGAQAIVLLHAHHVGTYDAEYGTVHCLNAAAKNGIPHIVYLSRVGAELVPAPQWMAADIVEQVLAENSANWTAVRSTMTHSTVRDIAYRLVRGNEVRVPGMWPTQSISDEAVVNRLATLTVGPPQGRVADIAGPSRVALTTVCREMFGDTYDVYEVETQTALDEAFHLGHHLPPLHPTPDYPGVDKLGTPFGMWFHRQRPGRAQ